MSSEHVQSGWLQQQTLDGIKEINVECDQVDLTIESDENLAGMVQLVVQPAENAPQISRTGTILNVRQSGRYRGKVTPTLRVPPTDCPETGINLGKGEISIQHVSADVAVKVGMGDVEVIAGDGHALVSVGMGDLAVVDRQGNVSLKSGMGDVAVVRCSGSVSVSAGKGDIAVNDSGPDVSVKTGRGDVAVIRPLGGGLVVSSGSGDVSVNDGEASSVAVHTGKGDIRATVRLVADSNGQAAPEPSDDDEAAFFDGEDEFSLEDIQFEANEAGVRVARGNRDILRLGPEGIRIRGGKREISLGPDGIRVGEPGESSSEERFTFETARGDVQVAVPNDLNLRVEVLATGDVQSDVPLVSVGRPGPRGTVKRYVGVADGAGSGSRTNVRVRTKRGDVSVRSMRVQPRAAAPAPADEDEIDRDEQARVILEALARGELSVNEAERLLQNLDSGD